MILKSITFQAYAFFLMLYSDQLSLAIYDLIKIKTPAYVFC